MKAKAIKLKDYYNQNKIPLIIIGTSFLLAVILLVGSHLLLPKKRRGLENFKNLTIKEKQDKLEEMKANRGDRSIDRVGSNRRFKTDQPR